MHLHLTQPLPLFLGEGASRPMRSHAQRLTQIEAERVSLPAGHELLLVFTPKTVIADARVAVKNALVGRPALGRSLDEHDIIIGRVPVSKSLTYVFETVQRRLRQNDLWSYDFLTIAVAGDSVQARKDVWSAMESRGSDYQPTVTDKFIAASNLADPQWIYGT